MLAPRCHVESAVVLILPPPLPPLHAPFVSVVPDVTFPPPPARPRTSCNRLWLQAKKLESATKKEEKRSKDRYVCRHTIEHHRTHRVHHCIVLFVCIVPYHGTKAEQARQYFWRTHAAPPPVAEQTHTTFASSRRLTAPCMCLWKPWFYSSNCPRKRSIDCLVSPIQSSKGFISLFIQSSILVRFRMPPVSIYPHSDYSVQDRYCMLPIQSYTGDFFV